MTKALRSRHRKLAIVVITTLAVAAIAPCAPAQDNWPQFRGANADGLGVDGQGLPDTWSETENVVWKTPVPGKGWSSPIVWGDKVFVTTAVREVPEGEQGEEIKKGLVSRAPALIR